MNRHGLLLIVALIGAGCSLDLDQRSQPDSPPMPTVIDAAPAADRAVKPAEGPVVVVDLTPSGDTRPPPALDRSVTGDRPDPCQAKYGKIQGYLPCPNTDATTCTFIIATQKSCEDACGKGQCVSAWDDVLGQCPTSLFIMYPCDEDHYVQVCKCKR